MHVPVGWLVGWYAHVIIRYRSKVILGKLYTAAQRYLFSVFCFRSHGVFGHSEGTVVYRTIAPRFSRFFYCPFVECRGCCFRFVGDTAVGVFVFLPKCDNIFLVIIVVK